MGAAFSTSTYNARTVGEMCFLAAHGRQLGFGQPSSRPICVLWVRAPAAL